MGSVRPAPAPLKAETTGAEGDDLVLIADGREVARATIPDGGRLVLSVPDTATHVRAEIEARASRDQLIAQFRNWLDQHEIPRGELPAQGAIPPILRAMANPHYFGDWT